MSTISRTTFLNTSLTRAFSTIVKERADQPALVQGSKTITYGELDSLSTAMATELLKLYPECPDMHPALGATQESQGDSHLPSSIPVVGVYLPRSIENIVAFVAGAKAGVACAPTGVDWPNERVRGIVDKCSVKAMISQKAIFSGRPWENVVSLLETDIDRIKYGQGPTLLGKQKDGKHIPLYIIHTSGSTGEPKGVVISHDNVFSQFKDPAVFSTAPGARIMHVNAVTFDLSIQEIWGGLLGGCTIIVTDTPVALDPARLRRHFDEESIDVAILSTAMFNIIAVQEPGTFSRLKTITMCGEPPNREAIEKVYQKCPNTVIMNTYGPAECTVFAAAEMITDASFDQEMIPAGIPTPAASLHIVDDRLNLLPTGTQGEIVIGSGCVGMGYLNAPELTNTVFCTLPSSGERVYRTGDYGKMTVSGRLIVLGRLDNQVKISGYRVEPGEVCSMLMKHAEVRMAHVLTEKKPDPQLLAYVVPQRVSQPQLPTHLSNYLREFLPSYMIPKQIIIVSELPLTPHGKVDAARLPKPASDKTIQTDETILGLFRNLLNKPDYSEEDSFLESGGSSIKAARIIAQVRRTTGVSVPFALMTGERTAYHVNKFIEKSSAEEYTLMR